MRTVGRRVALASIAALALAFSSNSGSPEELNVEANEGCVGVTRYAAHRVGKRPAVLVLHGNRGVEFNTRAYERYANALAAGGIDAYLVHYFTAEDHQALDPKKSARVDGSNFIGRSCDSRAPRQFRPHRVARILVRRLHRR